MLGGSGCCGLNGTVEQWGGGTAKEDTRGTQEHDRNQECVVAQSLKCVVSASVWAALGTKNVLTLPRGEELRTLCHRSCHFFFTSPFGKATVPVFQHSNQQNQIKMRASVGAIAIYLAFISCSCTSTALAKSTAATTTTIDNNKARLRRRAQRDVIDVQIPEKNGASNVATKEDEMALFELETAQFVNRFLQQSGSGNRRKRNQDSDDESADEDAEDISEDAVEEESEEPEPEDEEDNESIAAVDDFAPDTDDTGNQNFADPAAIIAENLNIKADIKFEQAPKNEPSDCSDMSEDERADAIRKQLSEITDLEVLDNDMTPQGKAFDWITYFDNARLCPGGSDKYLLNQRYALATLYFSTNGDDWFACFMSDPNCASTSISVSDFNPSIGGAMGSSSWLSGASAGSECSWHGIRCNDDKYVQKLEIGK